jgi:small GTP-binding protein
MKIALAGNPNCGKTTLFNDLTGSAQYVGNWPGVTVEKKDGILTGHKEVVIQDLPGIYSLSPYSMEEVVARSYLVNEKPDAILNIVDGSNIERNLYLTTQLLELGLPMIVAVNMMDVVRRNGDKIDTAKLAKALGCPVIEISALKGEGTKEAAALAMEEAKKGVKNERPHVFTGSVEHALAHIEESLHGNVDKASSRWAAIKVFERDVKAIETLGVPADIISHVEDHIKDCEKEMDDDAESIITAQRYTYIQKIVGETFKRSPRKASTTLSDKIDKIVTHRILALPIFIISLCAMWWLAVAEKGPGTILTDWANDGFLGEDGWHLPFTTHECKKDGPYKEMDYEAAQEFYAPHEKNIEAWEAAYVEAYNEANKGKAGFEEMKELGDAEIDEKIAATVTAEVKLDDDEETGEPVEGVVSVGKDGLVKVEKCEHAPGACSLAREADKDHLCDECKNDEGEAKEACEHCAKVAKWRDAYIAAYDAKHGKGAYGKALEEFNDKAENEWRKASAEARAAAKAAGKTYVPKSLFEESEFEVLDEALLPAVVAANGKAPGECGCCGHEAKWKCDWAMYKASKGVPEVEPSDYGVFVPGLTALIGGALEKAGIGETVKSLVVDGAWGGVATVLGFVPVICIVFLFLAFLEDCGYMARVAFIMDRLFRKFGLSGKSFIPMIVGKGCGVPAVMAARTIESERDRRMTIILATFIPCGAKTVIIAMFAALFFREMWYVAPLMDVIGIAIIVLGGIALKKSRAFAGEAAPFVMELPAYHMPTLTGIWRHTWTRVKGYMLKAGLIIFPACVFLWFIMHFDFSLSLLGDEEIDKSILATVGGWIAWLFAPLGFGSWQGAAASVSAEIAKEQATATLGLVAANMPGDATATHIRWLFASLSDFPKLAAFSFMLFNLFVPPCMVAIAVTFREMGSKAWGWFAMGFQLFVGYTLALSAYQIGMLMAGGGFGVWTAVAILVDLFCLWMIFRPARKAA